MFSLGQWFLTSKANFGFYGTLKCLETFLFVTACREGTLMVAADRRPEGCGTSFHMQGILSASPNVNGPVAKGLDVDHQKNALLTSSEWDVRIWVWSPMVSVVATGTHPGLLRTASHGCHHHTVFLMRPFSLTAFDSFPHMTFNFIKLLSTNSRMRRQMLILALPVSLRVLSILWYCGWNPGLTR